VTWPERFRRAQRDEFMNGLFGDAATRGVVGAQDNLDEPDGREPLRPATRSGRALRRLFISEVSLTKSQIEACVATAIDRRKES